MTDYELQLLQENKNLMLQIGSMNKEIKRKSYIAAGLFGLILKSKNDKLELEAATVIKDADKEIMTND
jgi:hypothetical protein